MKLRKSLVLALLLMASMVCFSAMAQESDKITQAVMKVYNDHIDKNPNDYNALFMRANQLYYNNDFKGAMNDVNRTIELAPEKGATPEDLRVNCELNVELQEFILSHLKR